MPVDSGCGADELGVDDGTRVGSRRELGEDERLAALVASFPCCSLTGEGFGAAAITVLKACRKCAGRRALVMLHWRIGVASA